MQQRHSGCLEYAIHELVPFLPVPPTVAGIIQLDAHARAHCRWIADQEIDVLPVDLVSIRLVLVRAGDIEHVAEVDFRADDCPTPNCQSENAVKRELGGREKVVTLPVREFLGPDWASKMDTEQGEDRGEATFRFWSGCGHFLFVRRRKAIRADGHGNGPKFSILRGLR